MSDNESNGTDERDLQALADRLADRFASRFFAFEERMSELEDGLRDEVARIRASVQVTDLLADDLRRSLEERVDDNPMFARITQLEELIRSTSSSAAPAEVDLGPVLDVLGELRGAATDLAPLHQRLDELTASMRGAGPDLGPVVQQLEALGRKLDDLGGPDLAPMRTEITDHIDALSARIATPGVDLGPVQERLEALAEAVAAGRPDLAALRAAIDDLRSVTPDFSPLADRIDALAERRPARRRRPETDPSPPRRNRRCGPQPTGCRRPPRGPPG